MRRMIIVALLCALSYAQTGAGGDTGAPNQQVASCWPWWCFPSPEAQGDNSDSDICKFWIADALARGCSPFASMPQAFQPYMFNPLFPVGPVMGPGMPIQGPPPMLDGDEKAVMQGMMMQGMGPQMPQMPQQMQPAVGDTGVHHRVVDAANHQVVDAANSIQMMRMMTGQDVEVPDVEMPEQDMEGMMPYPYAAPMFSQPAQTPKDIRAATPEFLRKESPKQEEPVLKKAHHSKHTKKLVNAMKFEEEWNSTGMWFGLSFLLLILGALAGYGIMNYLQKRQAMNCWATYGWDVPLTSRTDSV